MCGALSHGVLFPEESTVACFYVEDGHRGDGRDLLCVVHSMRVPVCAAAEHVRAVESTLESTRQVNTGRREGCGSRFAEKCVGVAVFC